MTDFFCTNVSSCDKAVHEVFNIPKEKDRVLVRKCELTPQKAADVCHLLVEHLVESGMAASPGEEIGK